MAEFDARLRALLADVQAGRTDIDAALHHLRDLPFADMGFARLDHHRTLRTGVPEVVFGQGKTPEQVAQLVVRLYEREGRALATRVAPDAWAQIQPRLPAAHYDPLARVVTAHAAPPLIAPDAPYAIVATGGTSDMPVALEAALTLEFLGNRTVRLFDVGVAGLHRLLAYYDTLVGARAIVAVAGMEGALPGVVKGLVGCPVVAVPTSIGYGANFAGLSALLTMLNSCAPGIAVVNIDNGFGAAVFAHLVLRQPPTPQEP